MALFFNDPKREYLKLSSKIDEAVSRVFRKGNYLHGEETKLFEEEFAAYCNVPHCITVANGTDALEIALRALECHNAEVITVANAGGYSTCACNIVGATPVYIDIESTTLSLSLEAVANALTPKTKAIIATHLYGLAVDVPRLRQILNSVGRADVMIIEDCAQAHGARLYGQLVGSFGDVAGFSFYPTKNLGAIGDGGALLTKSDELAQRIKRLKQYGWGKKYNNVDYQGRNSRLDELQAAILRVKLPELDNNNTRRRTIINSYQESLPQGMRIVAREDESFVGHLCIVCCDNRDEARTALSNSGVPTDIHYPVLDCDQPMMLNQKKRSLSLSVSRDAVKRIFSLPCFPEMTELEVQHVCRHLSLIAT